LLKESMPAWRSIQIEIDAFLRDFPANLTNGKRESYKLLFGDMKNDENLSVFTMGTGNQIVRGSMVVF
jgi:hypothetical protein